MSAEELLQQCLLYAREPFTWHKIEPLREYLIGVTKYSLTFPKNEKLKSVLITLPDGNLSDEVILNATQVLCRLELTP